MSGFYWYEHIYTYRSKQEFKNIFEIKICNCFGQLLLILKMLKMETEHDMDSN